MDCSQFRGIIFDMDNTLLGSNIDFLAMKNELYNYFVGENVLPADLSLDHHTCATVIGLAQQNAISEIQEEHMWNIAEKHEMVGMRGAALEPGVRELLQHLKDQLVMVVLTNNAQAAAERALTDTGIYHYFDLIVGREKMKVLKPSSSGVKYILDSYPDIQSNHWISIGDSWIDGKAAQDAGVAFICYQRDMEWMNSKGVDPLTKVDNLLDIIDVLKK
jgi:phosphoglycolate phosphatase